MKLVLEWIKQWIMRSTLKILLECYLEVEKDFQRIKLILDIIELVFYFYGK